MLRCPRDNLFTVRHTQSQAFFINIIYFRAGRCTPWGLLTLMEIDDNVPRPTFQCTLTVQIGSELRGNIGVMAEKAFQPGLPKLGSPLLFCILRSAGSCAVALKMSNLGGKP